MLDREKDSADGHPRLWSPAHGSDAWEVTSTSFQGFCSEVGRFGPGLQQDAEVGDPRGQEVHHLATLVHLLSHSEGRGSCSVSGLCADASRALCV